MPRWSPRPPSRGSRGCSSTRWSMTRSRAAWAACFTRCRYRPRRRISAMPGRLILLRHGEKGDGFRLCSTGLARSLALAQTYLGKNAGHSLFAGDEPAAFFALTPHTIEPVSPSAAGWGLPVLAYSLGMLAGSAKELAMNLRTREAAADLLRSKWDGKTVVVRSEEHTSEL